MWKWIVGVTASAVVIGVGLFAAKKTGLIGSSDETVTFPDDTQANQ